MGTKRSDTSLKNYYFPAKNCGDCVFVPLCLLEHPKRGVQAQGRLVLPLFRWADLSV
jgi:hypothetical protein